MIVSAYLWVTFGVFPFQVERMGMSQVDRGNISKALKCNPCLKYLQMIYSQFVCDKWCFTGESMHHIAMLCYRKYAFYDIDYCSRIARNPVILLLLNAVKGFSSDPYTNNLGDAQFHRFFVVVAHLFKLGNYSFKPMSVTFMVPMWLPYLCLTFLRCSYARFRRKTAMTSG